MRGILAFAVLAVTIALAGCAATAPARHHISAAQERAQKAQKARKAAALLAAKYRQQYLADVALVKNAAEPLRRNLPNKRAIRVYKRLAYVEQNVAGVMLRQQWPASARGDIRAFATALSVDAGADEVVATDFRYDPAAYSVHDEVYWGAGDVSMSPDLQRDVTDVNASTALDQRCRADLGLPPLSG
jgi:hypothetical protein